MANPYFTPSGVPATNAAATSSTMRGEFNLIEDAFDLLPTLSGNGSKIIAVNSGASALEAITTTGTGSGVRATSPTLTTPTIGVATATSINKVAITAPATSATLTIADGKTLTASNTLTFTGTDASSVAFGTGGTVAYTANKLSAFAATTSAELAGVLSDETGTGALVFANTPTLVTPVLGVATATSVNKVAITAPATSATLTIANGKTLTANASLTLTGTDSTTMTFPSTTATIARTDAAQTFTGTQTFSGALRAADGTGAAPAYSFTNDVDTGMALGANSLLFYYGANSPLFLDAGMVGIQNGATFALTDGMTAPSTVAGFAQIYVDSSDGDLKVKFGDGTVKTIVADT